MSDKTHESDEISNEVHIKKHDHSFLGKHTKEDKRKYIEGLRDSIATPINSPLLDNDDTDEKEPEPIINNPESTKRTTKRRSGRTSTRTKRTR